MLSSALLFASGQLPGTLKVEKHPSLEIHECTKAGGCTSQSRSVVIDANWRWVHATKQADNCFTGNKWESEYCPVNDTKACLENCRLEGANVEYNATYGVATDGDELTLTFVKTRSVDFNVGSRVFLLENDTTYKTFNLLNKEITFDVDVSQLPCGLNGALYFVQMDADGGMARYPGNKAGAKYGTGYCDAQCPHDLKYINGEPNVIGWTPSDVDIHAGMGKYGSCCVEMDLWEANAVSSAYTAHSCAVQKQTRCSGVDCGDGDDRFKGVCDKNGCDYQTFRLGERAFYGAGSSFAINTDAPMRVTTQFITADNTDSGKLVEIRRIYKQGNTTVQNPPIKLGGASFDSLKGDFCKAELAEFKDNTNFLDKGGFDSMGDAMSKGMVLTLSLWDDHFARMLWLDSDYPPDVSNSTPGVARGTCATTSGQPQQVEYENADATVRYMNIRYGELGSTDVGPAPPPGPSPPPVPPGQCTIKPWAQCDGEGYTGQKCCPAGFECTFRSKYFYQCTSSTALFEAFMRTAPTQDEMQDFLTTGTTHFSASGVGPRLGDGLQARRPQPPK